jgi:hypothetical protein
MRAFALAVLMLVTTACGAFAQELGDYTYMTRSPGHGTQVEYMSSGGKTYLWYSGNTVILEGRWKREGSDVCFAYGENTYNPVTGTSGGGWECTPYRRFVAGISERMQGDILALAGRSGAPFKLSPDNTTLERLMAKVSPNRAAPPVEVGAVLPNGETVLSCASIIANAERSKADMQIAASTYFHGQFMGKPCVEIDYAKAIALTEASGTSPEPFLRILRERAANGHPLAINALKRLGY